ncbi:MAG: hypothetical protein CMD98_06390 [Gammaproteobacteria bacterium]|nr:hypothetical protein [Gammaproteobacteria bacterium]|tara:strand:+ start:3205 stop:4032 length:828 start_codon:yes stop_codon:yes gene_type:complete
MQYDRNRNYNFQDLSGQTFKDTDDFDKCTFVGANLSGCTFENNYMRGCDFSNANMDNIKMHNVNMRESSFYRATMRNGTMTECNINRCNFTDADGRNMNFTDSDLRMCNFRNAMFPHTDFTNCWLKGIGMRGTKLERSNLHEFLRDYTFEYKFLPPDTICHAWKLANDQGKGIYHPKIKYYEGLVANAEQQDNGFKKLNPEGKGENTNSGIAIAPIDWVLREWNMLGCNPNWKLFRVSFKAGDLIKSEGNAKFNVKEMVVEKEYDLKQFYDQMKD